MKRWWLVVALLLVVLHHEAAKALRPVYIFLEEKEASLQVVFNDRTQHLRSHGFPVSTYTVLINNTNLYYSILKAHNNEDDWSAILDLTSGRTCVLFEVASTRRRPFLSIHDGRCRVGDKRAPTTVTPSDQQYLDAVTGVVQQAKLTDTTIHIAIFYDNCFSGTTIPTEEGWNETAFYFLYPLSSSINKTHRLLLELRKDVDVYTFIVLASKTNIEVLLDHAADLQMLGSMGAYYRWFVVTKEEDELSCPKCSGTDVIHLHHVIMDHNALDGIKRKLLTINTAFSMVKTVYAYDSLMYIFDYLLLANARDPNSTPKNETSFFSEYLSSEKRMGIFGPVGVTKKTPQPEMELDIDKVSHSHATKVGTWSSHQGVRLIEPLFPTDRRLPLLRVLTISEHPFVIIEEISSSDGSAHVNYSGYTVDVLNRIASTVPFEFELYRLDDLEKRKPGISPYDEMVALLADGVVDMVAATLSVTLKRTEVVDFTIPYYDYAGIQILMKKPNQNKNIFNFLTVFSWKVWVTIAGTLALMTILVHLIDRFSPFSYQNRRHLYPEGGKVYTIKESAWFVMGSFTKSGEGDSPKACSSRLLVAGYWFFCMVIMATFTANLAAFLTASRLKTPVASLDDLAQQSRMNYSVVRGHDAHSYFSHMARIEETFYDRWKEMSLGPDSEESTDSASEGDAYQYAVWDYPLGDKFTKILKHIKSSGILNTTEEGINKVASSDDFAFLHMAPVLKYEAGLDCSLTVVGDQFSNKPFAFALQKHSPLTAGINQQILKLQRDHELENFKRHWWEDTEIECPQEEDENTSITMDTVGGVFIAMSMGIGLCFIALVAEVTCTKYMRQKGVKGATSNGTVKNQEGSLKNPGANSRK